MSYDSKTIEQKWQKYWEENNLFRSGEKSDKKKFYLLEMFPYPSGKLHMGHARNYAIGDTLARFLRMNDYNLLYPMGYDAFGLPAENAAIKNKINPEKWTDECINTMKEQQKKLGLSYDWNRLVVTAKPEYYKWNQWIFTKFFEKGLAFKKQAPTNFCPKDQTVLANEQVIDGKCWRCQTEVEVKDLEQWFYKITDYAEELLKDIEKLTGWPERVRIMQHNWIGKSDGLSVNFPVKNSDKNIEIFTTRPDTLFGVTFMTFAAEHPLVMELVKGTEKEKEIKDFVNKIVIQKRITRLEEKEKEGIFTGKYAINPLTGDEIPIYVGNFVLMEYGTGAIMCVPAHDQRDFEFAKKYNIPIKEVIQPFDSAQGKPLSAAFVEEGTMVNSQQFNGINSKDAIAKISVYIEEKKFGKRVIHYKLRDWLISRQRYWGTPIPIIYCEKCGTVPVPEKDLPVLLPKDVEFTGEGNPLSKSSSFVSCKCPKCNAPARRETDTMDTFVDSSWYFERYCDPKQDKLPFSKEKVSYWMPVNQYIGGIEHAVLHLLYSRFYTKALRDLGLLNYDEPFQNLLCQGMVVKDGFKMSKSKGNVVSVDDMIDKYGADTARLFILFASPPERDLEWSDEGVLGCYRFVNKIWNLVQGIQQLKIKKPVLNLSKDEKLSATEPFADPPNTSGGKNLERIRNLTIKKVTIDIQKEFHFNTAIASIMEFYNELTAKQSSVDYETFKISLETLIILLSPFAPHICEEMWQVLGHNESIIKQNWPKWDEEKLKQNEVTIAVQINGKLRGQIDVNIGLSEQEIMEFVKSNEKIHKYIINKKIIKTIYVPQKILNIVVGG
ncbi:MAG: leucine--tRNA ligase [Elusimicrobia bacterium RIFOXYD2_FULL_34_15]|nr:MAG: leucine--tRNA ligase [Elusimicrobia bacterium RIFOXYD2_FULL_34_15]